MTEPLQTAHEVSEYLGVSTETVLRWARCGKLPALRLPSGQVRFRQADIDAGLAATATGMDITGPARLG